MTERLVRLRNRAASDADFYEYAENLEKENQELKKELIAREVNKPIHVAISADDFEENRYGQIASNIKMAKSENAMELLPMIRVFDTNGSEIILPISGKFDPKTLERGRRVFVNGESLIIGTDGYYQGGEILPFERLLEDERLVLKSEAGSNAVICWPAKSLDIHSLKPGDGIRFIGEVALENVGQSLNLDELAVVPDPKEFSDIVGKQWQRIFDTFERKIHLLYNRIQNSSTDDTARKWLACALWGLNGNGKTTGAKALAWYAAQKFEVADKNSMIVVKAGEIISKYVGQTQNNIANIFKKLRQMSSEHGFAILLIDEFDALAHSSDVDVESSWIRSSIVPQWKTELQGPIPLENVLIVVTLNDKKNVDAAILRRFWDQEVVAELEAVPVLVNKTFKRESTANIQTERIADSLMNFLRTFRLGRLQFANKHWRDFHPADIMSYADIESVCIEGIECAEYEDRKPKEADVIACATNLFLEKAKRIRVGTENGFRRSNARDYFATLSDEEFSNLDKVLLYDKTTEAENVVCDDVEDL